MGEGTVLRVGEGTRFPPVDTVRLYNCGSTAPTMLAASCVSLWVYCKLFVLRLLPAGKEAARACNKEEE